MFSQTEGVITLSVVWHPGCDWRANINKTQVDWWWILVRTETHRELMWPQMEESWTGQLASLRYPSVSHCAEPFGWLRKVISNWINDIDMIMRFFNNAVWFSALDLTDDTCSLVLSYFWTPVRDFSLRSVFATVFSRRVMSLYPWLL